MLFLGRQQETEREQQKMFKSSFSGRKKKKNLGPGQGRRAEDGCERGKAAGSASRGCGEGQGMLGPLAPGPGGQGGARAPFQEFIGMGRLPVPPPPCPEPAGQVFYWSHWDRLRRTDRT